MKGTKMIHNGIREQLDAEKALLEKWRLPEVIGTKKVVKPSIMLFNNEIQALRLLEKHIKADSKIAIHFDVDFDGIASGYIMNRELIRRGLKKKIFIINKEKEHGMKQKHADYINNNRCCDLLIVVDSSTNEIDTIRSCNCDVLVIDHHDCSTNVSCGMCTDGVHQFVIVNSTIECFDFEEGKYELSKLKLETLENVEKCCGTNKMSCGLLVYEIMRLWYGIYNNSDIIDKSRIYQWAAASLYTDQIDLIDERNQWYIQNMNCDKTIDEALLQIGQSIGKYCITMNKSYVQFKLAPLINKAIRAEAGGEVLDRIINKPNTLGELVKYDAKQRDAIETAMKNMKEHSNKSYVMVNITGLGISKNYNGVIASRICGDESKNTVVYLNNGSIYKGSFRGRIKGTNYRVQAFNDCGLKAEGHPEAFGFEAYSEEEIEKALIMCDKIEPKDKHVKQWVSLGNVDEDMRGVYHIESLNELRQSRMLLMLAYGNSNVSSADEIMIVASTKDVVLSELCEKYRKYTWLGDAELIAFEALSGEHFNIYAEFGNEIKLFARNM